MHLYDPDPVETKVSSVRGAVPSMLDRIIRPRRGSPEGIAARLAVLREAANGVYRDSFCRCFFRLGDQLEFEAAW